MNTNTPGAVEVCFDCDIADCHHIRARRAAMNTNTPGAADALDGLSSFLNALASTVLDGATMREWSRAVAALSATASVAGAPSAATGAIDAREQEVPDDLKLMLLMAPYHLNLVVGHDRTQLLAFGRDVWAAAKRGDSPTVRTRNIAAAPQSPKP